MRFSRSIWLVLTCAVLIIAPFVLPSFSLDLLNYAGLAAMVALGLVLLTGIGGLTSFGQAAFVGIGAYASAWLCTSYVGVSPWYGLLLGLLVSFILSYLIGLITVRLSGHFLPLGTLAWGISIYYLFSNLPFLGGHTGLPQIPPITLVGVELTQGWQLYVLIWSSLLLAILALSHLLNSREGRAIRALNGGMLMAESMGINTAHLRLAIFIIAALLASASGWLYVHLQRFVNPTPFGLNIGIEYLFMAVIGGVGHLWGAVLGALSVTLIKDWLQRLLPSLLDATGDFEVVVFGIILVLMLHKARDGLWPKLSGIFYRPKPLTSTPLDSPIQLDKRIPKKMGDVLLETRSVTKQFGGLVANKNMSLQVHAGEIVALIGPNGAGKSTMFNLISGVLPPSSGEIIFLDENVTQQCARHIAKRGLARTFQHVKLLPSMSVLENVAMGAYVRNRRSLLTGMLSAICRLDRPMERALLSEAKSQLDRVGLTGHENDQAGSLPLGKQRILEIARALCMNPYLLLLDEPAAGLRHLEKQALAATLKQLRDDGMGILLVEHDMDFVMGLADRVIVMEFGEKIAEGLPNEIQSNPRVLEAYLGGVE